MEALQFDYHPLGCVDLKKNNMKTREQTAFMKGGLFDFVLAGNCSFSPSCFDDIIIIIIIIMIIIIILMIIIIILHFK